LTGGGGVDWGKRDEGRRGEERERGEKKAIDEMG